ncbi:hypothetical protein [Plesiomonas shigelloides]|uniref:hypothetical protein n=1 Tax=Plesiomonas shigelloides TaxID=703 RepID=UPI001E32EB85|nr:hypothetical protein [Plesiomonas shigelloides]
MTNYQNLDQLATEFFKVFSRSEYALKAAGFHNGDGNAMANWATFAEAVEVLIQEPNNKQLHDAIEFIFQNPPKKQMILNDKICWSNVHPNRKLMADNLLVYVCRVRNNLFHGGKFNGHWFEPERSEQLIKNSLIILNACINSVQRTRDSYHG